MIPIENFEIIGNIYETIDDKAKELVEKFTVIQNVGIGNTEEELAEDMTNKAKQCALICVDEIIKALEPYETVCSLTDEYQKVKEKIQSL